MTSYCGLRTREEGPERAVQRSGLAVRALHPKPVLTRPTLNLPDPRMDLCRIQSRLSLGQGREGGRGSEGAVWMLLMDSCSWLAAPCAVLENERAWSRPQNAAKPLVQGGRKGLELYSSKGHEGKKPSMCFFFLLPSFVFSPLALKKLLIIISVQLETQSLMERAFLFSSSVHCQMK